VIAAVDSLCAAWTGLAGKRGNPAMLLLSWGPAAVLVDSGCWEGRPGCVPGRGEVQGRRCWRLDLQQGEKSARLACCGVRVLAEKRVLGLAVAAGVGICCRRWREGEGRVCGSSFVKKENN